MSGNLLNYINSTFFSCDTHYNPWFHQCLYNCAKFSIWTMARIICSWQCCHGALAMLPLRWQCPSQDQTIQHIKNLNMPKYPAINDKHFGILRSLICWMVWSWEGALPSWRQHCHEQMIRANIWFLNKFLTEVWDIQASWEYGHIFVGGNIQTVWRLSIVCMSSNYADFL